MSRGKFFPYKSRSYVNKKGGIFIPPKDFSESPVESEHSSERERSRVLFPHYNFITKSLIIVLYKYLIVKKFYLFGL